MAILIPSINQTKLPELRPAGKAVLDRENRPQVNLSGVAQAAGNLGRAGAMPNVDPSAFVAEARALGAVGQAIGQAGDVLSAAQMKRYQAQNDIDVADADAQLMQHEQDFEVWKMKHPDPRDWESEWASRQVKALETVTGNEKLSDDARQAISLRAKTWGARSGIMVARDATKETFARAKSAWQSQYLRASESGDDQAVKSILQSGVQKGYGYEHEAVGMEQQHYAQKERKQKQTQRDAREFDINRFTGLMSEDPFQAEEILKQRGEDGRNQYFQHLDDTDLVTMQGHVKSAIRNRQAEAFEVLQDQIVSGQADDGKIEETGKLVHLGARDIVRLQDFRRKIAEDAASGKPMDTAGVLDVKTAIEKFNPDQADKEQALREWADLKMRADQVTATGGTLGTQTRGVFNQSLYQKHPLHERRITGPEKEDFQLLQESLKVLEPDWKKVANEKERQSKQLDWLNQSAKINADYQKAGKEEIQKAGGPTKWLQKKLSGAIVTGAVDSIFDGPDASLFPETQFNSAIK